MSTEDAAPQDETVPEHVGDKVKDALNDTFGAGAGNQAEGAVKEALGNTQQAIGDLTGDNELKGEGKVTEAEGDAQGVVGDVEEKAESMGEKIEDFVEQAKGAFESLVDKVKDVLDGDDDKHDDPTATA